MGCLLTSTIVRDPRLATGSFVKPFSLFARPLHIPLLYSGHRKVAYSRYIRRGVLGRHVRQIEHTNGFLDGKKCIEFTRREILISKVCDIKYKLYLKFNSRWYKLCDLLLSLCGAGWCKNNKTVNGVLSINPCSVCTFHLDNFKFIL